ncbi:hypothetical protein [Pontivivens ytuae]|uniref:Uncharacterized protein n=1 Tax=Pontivivens ytuae TaxID=2789856 RepID=A0A7S9LPG8_9RHOB|nr:hypothetical protein [Pontivivens ytuae]QPH52767.1 hypothetical protein I0K15_13210 [Pontivivens ytuae]
MDIHLPQDVATALREGDPAPKRAKTRPRARMGKQVIDLISLDETGFTVAGDAPLLRGHLSLYDGERHLADCLIVTAAHEGPLVRYEYKRRTDVTDTAALDYVRDPSAPVALLR